MYSTGWRRVYSSVWPFNLPLYAHSRLKYALKNKVFVVYVSRPAGRGEQTQTPNKSCLTDRALDALDYYSGPRTTQDMSWTWWIYQSEDDGEYRIAVCSYNWVEWRMHACPNNTIDLNLIMRMLQGKDSMAFDVCLPVCLFCFVFAHTELLILTVAKATEEQETEYHFDWTRTHTGRHHEIAGRAKLWPIYHLFPQAWYRTRGLLARSCHLLDISNRSGAGGSGQSLACARHRTGRLSTTNCTRLPPFSQSNGCCHQWS